MPPPSEHCDLQPPLTQGNPLMCPLEHLLRGGHTLKKDVPIGLELNNDDHWLSQVGPKAPKSFNISKVIF